jgi:ribokinase
MTVYNFGSINIDLVYRVPHLVLAGETLSSLSMDTVLGGKGANQSVAVARAGAAVCHVGRVGRADQWAVDQMQAAGVDITHIEQIDGASGHAIIQVDDHGENYIILHGGANQSFNRSLLESHLADATADDWLLVQNECNDISVAFDIAASKGMKIMFTPAPMTSEVAAMPLERCAVLIVNETEAESLAGTSDPEQILERLAGRYPDTRLVMTLGSKGALLQYAGHRDQHDAIKVDVVDTTGAGDTFVGYLLAAMIEGSDDATCLKRACTAAALSVTQAGAAPSIPDAAAVDEFLI